MATVLLPAEQRVVLENVSWETYERLLRENDRPGVRLTYDHGRLEIMTLSHAHENYSELLGRFIVVLAMELNIPIHSGGSTTFRRKLKLRGLEPDKCYWVQNELAMRGKKEFDIETDPPPDLVIEVDISSSSLDRMGIYSALGVREVWRFDGESLRVYRLKPNGKYGPGKRSRAFPFLPLSEVLRFLQESDAVDETSLVRSFREWVREHLAPAYEAAESSEARPRRRRPRRK